jgi:hypothetical protein
VRAHEGLLALIAKLSGGRCLWPVTETAAPAAAVQRSSG